MRVGLGVDASTLSLFTLFLQQVLVFLSCEIHLDASSYEMQRQSRDMDSFWVCCPKQIRARDIF